MIRPREITLALISKLTSVKSAQMPNSFSLKTCFSFDPRLAIRVDPVWLLYLPISIGWFCSMLIYGRLNCGWSSCGWFLLLLVCWSRSPERACTWREERWGKGDWRRRGRIRWAHILHLLNIFPPLVHLVCSSESHRS